MRHGWIGLLFVASSGCAYERADSSVHVPVCPRAEAGELITLETIERPIEERPVRPLRSDALTRTADEAFTVEPKVQ